MNENGDSGNALTRRDVVGAIGAGLIAANAAGSESLLEAADSQSQAGTPRNFSPAECRILEALGDTLLPGAAEAGIARYIDDQLSREMPLLFLSYMDYAGPYVDFYKSGLKALDEESRKRYGQSFTALDSEKKTALIRDLSQQDPPGWQGPPAPLFYFVTRNDAVDVYYGTPQGFDRLGVPYLAMIRPPSKW